MSLYLSVDVTFSSKREEKKSQSHIAHAFIFHLKFKPFSDIIYGCFLICSRDVFAHSKNSICSTLVFGIGIVFILYDLIRMEFVIIILWIIEIASICPQQIWENVVKTFSSYFLCLWWVCSCQRYLILFQCAKWTILDYGVLLKWRNTCFSKQLDTSTTAL